MKIVLPSNGVLGLRTVEMRPPTFQDLRNVVNLNQEDDLLKAQFTENLLKGVDLSKITKMDLDYLYTIAAMQVQSNQIGFSYTCKCGEKNKGRLVFGSQELVELPKCKLPYKTKFKDKPVEYNILSAQQHMDACEYALQQEDFETAYDDAVATFVFGKSLDQLDEIKSYDVVFFLSAHLFQRVMFHGVKLIEECKCQKCGHTNQIVIEPSADLVKMSMEMLMDQFTSVMTVLDFEAFLSFSVPEFTTFRDKVTAKN